MVTIAPSNTRGFPSPLTLRLYVLLAVDFRLTWL